MLERVCLVRFGRIKTFSSPLLIPQRNFVALGQVVGESRSFDGEIEGTQESVGDSRIERISRDCLPLLVVERMDERQSVNHERCAYQQWTYPDNLLWPWVLSKSHEGEIA